LTLFNSEGSALFGPGSEWFWAMAQFLVVVVTLFGIYRQLRAQGATNALARIETLHGRYDSKEMTLAKLQVAIDLRYGEPPSEMNAGMDPIGGFFDILHDQHEGGFMTLKEIDERFGGGAQIWWRLLGPAIRGSRAIESEPGLYEAFEKIEALCGRRALDRGSPRSWILEAPLPVLLDEVIKRTTERLQLLNSVASDAIPEPPASARATAT
jgi:hypothetical protein